MHDQVLDLESLLVLEGRVSAAAQVTRVLEALDAEERRLSEQTSTWR